MNLAERRADYWNFGGIFRPVFLEVKPAINLRHIAIDAQMDGSFRANCYTNLSNDGMSIRAQILDNKGKKLTETTVPVKAGEETGLLYGSRSLIRLCGQPKRRIFIKVLSFLCWTKTEKCCTTRQKHSVFVPSKYAKVTDYT